MMRIAAVAWVESIHRIGARNVSLQNEKAPSPGGF
jgi:hypothetical protein